MRYTYILIQSRIQSWFRLTFLQLKHYDKVLKKQHDLINLARLTDEVNNTHSR